MRLINSRLPAVSLGLALLTGTVVAPALAEQPATQRNLTTRVLQNLSPETQKLVIRGSNNTFSISGQVTNKQAVVKEIDQALRRTNSPKAIPNCIGPLCGDHRKTSSGSLNVLGSYIQVRDYFHYIGRNSGLGVEAVMDGNQSSAWYGSNPHRAQHIILGTNVKVDGLAISFSLPPGMSLSGSSDTASYTSVPFDNAWMATYQYNNLVARSLIGITGLHQTDSGTFRLNNNDYQTIASINFNLL